MAELPQAEDIVTLPIEMSEKITDSKFRLVHIAAQRVRQLSSGSPLLVSTRSIKDSTVALEEILADKLKVLVGEEAKTAKEEYEKRVEQARLEEELSAKEEEIRKELSVYLSEKHEGEESEVETAALDETDEEEPVEQGTDEAREDEE